MSKTSSQTLSRSISCITKCPHSCTCHHNFWFLPPLIPPEPRWPAPIIRLESSIPPVVSIAPSTRVGAKMPAITCISLDRARSVWVHAIGVEATSVIPILQGVRVWVSWTTAWKHDGVDVVSLLGLYPWCLICMSLFVEISRIAMAVVCRRRKHKNEVWVIYTDKSWENEWVYRWRDASSVSPHFMLTVAVLWVVIPSGTRLPIHSTLWYFGNQRKYVDVQNFEFVDTVSYDPHRFL
jgi:hypothetical protein